MLKAMSLLYRFVKIDASSGESLRVFRAIEGRPETFETSRIPHIHPKQSKSSQDDEWEAIRGVIFDMDGTLTVPALDFSEMKRRVGVPLNVDILSGVASQPPERREQSMRVIEEMEEEACRNLQLQPGVLELLHFLSERQVKRALMTRNNHRSVDVFLAHLQQKLEGRQSVYPSLDSSDLFSEVLTRDFKPEKPSPMPVLHICKQWSLPPSSVLVVGDSHSDTLCGYRAGAVTALLSFGGTEKPKEFHTDLTVSSPLELLEKLKAPIEVTRES